MAAHFDNDLGAIFYILKNTQETEDPLLFKIKKGANHKRLQEAFSFLGTRIKSVKHGNPAEFYLAVLEFGRFDASVKDLYQNISQNETKREQNKKDATLMSAIEETKDANRKFSVASFLGKLVLKVVVTLGMLIVKLTKGRNHEHP